MLLLTTADLTDQGGGGGGGGGVREAILGRSDILMSVFKVCSNVKRVPNSSGASPYHQYNSRRLVIIYFTNRICFKVHRKSLGKYDSE